MDIKDATDIFMWGVDYGLLLAEEERDSEDVFDAAGCAYIAAKCCIPSARAPRRQPHSAEWRKQKRSGLLKLINHCGAQMDAQECSNDECEYQQHKPCPAWDGCGGYMDAQEGAER